MFLYFTLLISWLGICHCLDVSYSIKEHSPPGTFIGNIGNSTGETRQSVKYSFLLTEEKVRKLFTLGESTGDLSLSATANLDREDICQYDPACVLRLEVAIRSTGEQYFRKISIDVTVEDINDHAPTFSTNFTSIQISESVKIPSSFPLPSALDRDTGPSNTLQSYQIVPSDGIFELSYSKGNPNLMLRVVDVLDHEKQAKYSIQVIARDGGDPVLKGVLNVEIEVGDVNDNRPVFTEDTYSKTVDESVAVGSLLLKLTANDDDSGDNGKVRYRFSPLQSPALLSMFSLNETSGELFVVGDFQKSDIEVYTIDVEAMDNAFTTKKTVTITVEDTTNSPPKLIISTLSSNVYSSISEYANLGIAVAHILVKDTDKGSNGIVQCHLDADGYFELQGYAVKEYKVIVARPLDRENISEHNVTVTCEDSGQTPLTATESFQVRVLDENDNPPKFSKRQWFASIEENNEIGVEIIIVSATDPDDPEEKNGQITYRLEDVSPGDFFINPESGAIKAMKFLDFELQRQYNFTVVAEDNGVPRRSDRAAVGLTIEDQNDQAPHFSQSQFTMRVSEYAKAGESVGKIMAFDLEQGPNGEIEISLLSDTTDESSTDSSNNSSLPFRVHPDGEVFLTSRIDFEDRSSYSFRVQVTDKGVPPLSDTTSVLVLVKDENDNRPTINHPNTTESFITTYTGSKSSNSVFVFDVHDDDSGSNGLLVYAITSRNDSGRFQVDQSSGVVRTNGEFSDIDAGIYKLTILVRDSGVPPLSDIRTLLIRVVGQNGTVGGTGVTEDQYIIIALIIVCITILLSVTIVLIIVIIRRMDRRRKLGSSSSSNLAGGHLHLHNHNAISTFLDPSKMGDMRHESTFKEKPNDYRDQHDTSMENKKSLEGQFGFPSSQMSGHSGDTYQMNNLDLPTSSSRDEDIDLEALQLRQVLLQTYHESQVPGLVPEDGASDSSGDTTTSDSGRGGSDEDVSNSNMAAAINSMEDSQAHNGSFQSNLSTFGQSGSLKSSVKDPVRSSARKHVTFQDMERFRNSIRSRTELPMSGADIALSQLTARDQQTLFQQNLSSPRDNTSNSSLPKEVKTNPRNENINIPRERLGESHFNINSPRGGLPQTKNSPRGNPFVDGVVGRDSPRLQTFPTSHSQSSNSLRLPFYEGHELPSHNEPLDNGKLPSSSSSSSLPSSSSSHYVQMSAPVDRLPQQQTAACSRPSKNSVPYIDSRSSHHLDSPSSSARNSPRNPPQHNSHSNSLPKDSHHEQRPSHNFGSQRRDIHHNNMNSNQLDPSLLSSRNNNYLNALPPLLPPRESRDSIPPKHPSSSFLPQGNPIQQKSSLLPDRGRMSRDRDWPNDSLANTEDGDDNRSTTTTSGSYTIDNEDNTLAFEFQLPHDIVV